MQNITITGPAPETGTNPIAGLPAELHHTNHESTICCAQKYPKIYVNAKTRKDENQRSEESDLFRVSRQTRGEALSVYSRTNSFVLHMNAFTVVYNVQLTGYGVPWPGYSTHRILRELQDEHPSHGPSYHCFTYSTRPAFGHTHCKIIVNTNERSGARTAPA